MTGMQSVSMIYKHLATGEHFTAVFTLIWKNPRMHRPLVDLQVRLGPERFLAVSASKVPLSFVQHLHMFHQLELGGEELSAAVAGIHLLGHHVALGVDSVAAGPVVGQRLRGCELCGAVLALVGSVRGVLGTNVVLECHAVDETFLPANLALIYNFSPSTSRFMNLFIISSS